MTRLEALCDAIKSHEGWYPFSRSWRNNNPGNLCYSRFMLGTDGKLAIFSSFTSGWLALWYDVYSKCKGNTVTGLGPTSTLLQFFNVWAPKSDGNDPVAYAQTVATKLGIPISTQLNYFLQDLT